MWRTKPSSMMTVHTTATNRMQVMTVAAATTTARTTAMNRMQATTAAAAAAAAAQPDVVLTIGGLREQLLEVLLVFRLLLRLVQIVLVFGPVMLAPVRQCHGFRALHELLGHCPAREELPVHPRGERVITVSH
jgi:hypothetical protein